jgi:Protein of unknown function (DUF2442)
VVRSFIICAMPVVLRYKGSNSSSIERGQPARAGPQRARFELSPGGLHWEELDEDISIAGLLAGVGDLTRKLQTTA